MARRLLKARGVGRWRDGGRALRAAIGSIAVAVLLCLSLACIGPEVRRSTFQDRTTATPLPIAPPPPAARRDMDLSVRQAFATLIDGDDTPGEGVTGVQPFRTDLAIALRFNRWVGLRILGDFGYGDPVGPSAPALAWPEGLAGAGGLGVIVGSWGGREPWSIHVELDGLAVGLPSRELWLDEARSCTDFTEASCGPWMSTGTHARQGSAAFGAAGLTVDAAGEVTPWLRLGGGLSLQSMITRDLAAFHWAPVGLARLFAELSVDPVSLVIEVQQPVSEELVLAPVLAVTARAVHGDRWTRDRAADEAPPEPPSSGGEAPPPAALGAWPGR